MFFCLCGVSALAAFYTKPNTITLPLLLLIVEIVFFQLSGKKLLIVLVTGMTSFILMLGGYYIFIDDELFSTISRVTQDTDLVNRIGYLSIQMGVLWGYIIKFLLPFNLHLILKRTHF